MARSAGATIYENQQDPAARVIYLGVPTFGQVSIRWHAHMLQLQSPLNRSVFHGYGLGFEVGQARNFLVQQALEWKNEHGHTVSHVFFVDDDVLVPPYALMVLLGRKRPIVSGLYYAKSPAVQPLILMEPSGGVLDPVPRNQVVDCFAHGMGCTLIEMRVFRDLLDRGFVDYDQIGAQRLPQFFKTTRDSLSQDHGAPVIGNETEDVHFLKLAAKLGYQPAVDTSVFSFHWDQKTQQAYPLHLWDEFQQTGKVTIGEKAA